MTLYDVLGIPDNAPLDEIKKKYRKLSLEHHPDRPTGNETKFKEINEAYEVLSDEERRKEYDNSLKPKPHMDIFEMLFRPDQFMNAHTMMFHNLMKPPPMNLTLQISLEQAYTGCKIPIKLERWVHVNQIRQLDVETIYIDIPQGIDTNECFVIQNKGNMGPDGSLGDVRITIQIVNPSKLERQGIDLIYSHDITLKEAICGFTFDLIYLQNQSLRITNTRGNIVHPNYKKIIPQMGMKRDSQVGNLIIQFNVVFPPSLSEEVLLQIETIL
jgi:DnaJ-class molecular chaperone